MPEFLDLSSGAVALDPKHPLIGAREARKNFSKVIEAARFKDTIVVITDYGKPAVAFISIKRLRQLDAFDRILKENPTLLSEILSYLERKKTPP